MLITQVHIEQGCASETQQQLLQRPKYIPKFPEEMTLRATSCASLSGTAQVAAASQPGFTLPRWTAPATRRHSCLLCRGSWHHASHPIQVPPLARSSPWYPYTPLKPRAVAAMPAARPQLGTGYWVWGNTKTAVHALHFGHLHSRFLKHHPRAPVLVILSYIAIIILSQILPVT